MLRHPLVVAIPTTAAATITFIMGWNALDLPRWAWLSELRAARDDLSDQVTFVADEVTNVRSLAVDNSLRILQNDWWRYQRELEDLEADLEKRPGDRTLISLRQRAREEQAEIQVQIDSLSSGR